MSGRADRVDPQVEQFLDSRSMPPPYALSVEGAREALNDALVVPPSDRKPVGHVRDLSIPGPGDDGIRVRLYAPEGEGPFPVLVYFHGGGWVRGNLDTHDERCRSMVTEAECMVVAVAYRRAPEHPFPAAVEDAYAATRWVDDTIGVFDGDPDRIAVGGGSAGGNLAAAVSLMSRDRNGPSLAGQLLLFPATDHAFDTPSYRENAAGYFNTKRGMQWYWNHYLPDEIYGRHPYASPLQARTLSGLPEATVITAGFDPLRDDGARYAERLRAADVPVRHENYPDMIHAFTAFPEQFDRARDARATIAEELRSAFR